MLIHSLRVFNFFVLNNLEEINLIDHDASDMLNENARYIVCNVQMVRPSHLLYKPTNHEFQCITHYYPIDPSHFILSRCNRLSPPRVDIVFYGASLQDLKTRLIERGFHTFIRNVLFFSPIDVGSHNSPSLRFHRSRWHTARCLALI